MEKKFLFFLYSVLFLGLTTMSTIHLSDQVIWSKYRTRLALEVAKWFCGGNINCDFTRKTEFQMITTPMSAIWDRDRNQLNKDVVGFAPGWTTSYRPRTTSNDGIISELYKNYLLNTKNLNQYKQFMSQQPTGDGIFYPWTETGITLSSFIQRARARGNNIRFSISMDVNSADNLQNDWATLGSTYTGGQNFIRSFTSETTSSDKNWNKKDIENYFDDKIKSDFIFGRSRTVYHHVYQTRTVVVETNKFHFKLDAIDIEIIHVEPSSSWFNRNAFLSDKNGISSSGFGGPGGRFPLLPHIVIVAYKPTVELIVSKSVYQQIKNEVDSGQILGWLVGGAKFRNPDVKALNDDGTVEFFSKSELSNSKKLADEIIFEKIKPKKKTKKSKKVFKFAKKFKKLEKFFDEISKKYEKKEETSNSDFLFRRIRLSDSDFLFRRIRLSDSDFLFRRRRRRSLTDSEFLFRRRRRRRSLSDSEFLFRRRRRHRTIVHDVIQEVPEGDYKITWVSHSEDPQILAVISDNVQL